MAKIERHTRFTEIANLDKELNSIINQIGNIAIGNIVETLPPVRLQKEFAIFYLKVNDDNGEVNYDMYRKIGGAYKRMKVDENSLVFWQ